MQSRATGACLDDSSMGLRGFGCNGLDFQRWNFMMVGDIYYRIQNMSTTRCLDHSNEYGLRTVNCNAGAYQTWRVVTFSGGIEVQNFGTGKCLDDSNLGVRAINCNGTVHQRWNFN
ncbi:hypothetical protein A5N83_00215 [Rhodococcus sp. 1139]|nr:hypothetical protein A5N83_00215 [Rhodococcus sp. 1139]